MPFLADLFLGSGFEQKTPKTASTGVLDLWVNGHRAWIPSPSTGAGCNSSTHTYTRTLTFATTGPLSMWIADATHGDDSGSLKVSIQRV